MNEPPKSLLPGRLLIVAAAVLWSFSGLLTRILQTNESLGLSTPTLDPQHMATFRALFAGLVMIPLVRLRKVKLRPGMPLMIVCFAAMNYFFLNAIARGSAANAILLQNTAPFFVFLVTVFFFKEKADRRSFIALVIGMIGMTIIVVSGSDQSKPNSGLVIAMAIASGVTYAIVILFLRAYRDVSPAFLSMQNHLGSAICLSLGMLISLGATAWLDWISTPTWRQLVFLAIFGAFQMALPYWLFAKGLRTVHPQEAGAITLLEPMLNPLWAYLVSPETDTPTYPMLLGGLLILGALAYRYLPNRKNGQAPG